MSLEEQLLMSHRMGRRGEENASQATPDATESATGGINFKKGLFVASRPDDVLVVLRI